MIINPARIISLIAVSGLGYTQKDTVTEMSDTLLDTARVAVTQLELSQIRTAVATELMFSGYQKMQRDFPAFVRGNMSAKGRDPATDFWGNHYELLVYADHLEIVSHGPDGEADTDDDVWVEIPK